jgi:hypothetical protein
MDQENMDVGEKNNTNNKNNKNNKTKPNPQ